MSPPAEHLDWATRSAALDDPDMWIMDYLQKPNPRDEVLSYPATLFTNILDLEHHADFLGPPISSGSNADKEDVDFEAALHVLGPARDVPQDPVEDGDALPFSQLSNALLLNLAWNPSGAEQGPGQSVMSETSFSIDDSLAVFAPHFMSSIYPPVMSTLSSKAEGSSGSSSSYHVSIRDASTTGPPSTEPGPSSSSVPGPFARQFMTSTDPSSMLSSNSASASRLSSSYQVSLSSSPSTGPSSIERGSSASAVSSVINFPRLYLTDDERWAATLARDANAEGHFLYCVLKTGIYNRPVCQSRRPDRRNVAFVLTSAEARERGCRPCKRCKPDEDVDPTSKRQVEAVEQLQRALSDEGDDPDGGTVTLKKAAEEMGVSMWHLSRLFKRIVGESPMVWAKAQKAQKSKQEADAEVRKRLSR